MAAVADLVCAECGRDPREDENAVDDWRAYRDVDDELPVFCLECSEREAPLTVFLRSSCTIRAMAPDRSRYQETDLGLEVTAIALGSELEPQ